jgi:hypothetical protein
MRKIPVGFLVSLIAFIFGTGIVIVWLFYQTSSFADIAPPALINDDCAESRNFPGLSRKISELKKGKSGYLPKDNFSGGWEKLDDFINDWYGEHLRAMGEKSFLDVSDENIETYRFLWLRSFHHPIFVRIEREENKIKLFTKELGGAGGYRPGKVLRSNKINLEKEEFCRFLNLLEDANFWKMPTKHDVLGEDGAQWILEGVKKGRYHIMDRWSPEKGEYREACVYLLKLSGYDVDGFKEHLY